MGVGTSLFRSLILVSLSPRPGGNSRQWSTKPFVPGSIPGGETAIVRPHRAYTQNRKQLYQLRGSNPLKNKCSAHSDERNSSSQRRGAAPREPHKLETPVRIRALQPAFVLADSRHEPPKLVVSGSTPDGGATIVRPHRAHTHISGESQLEGHRASKADEEPHLLQTPPKKPCSSHSDDRYSSMFLSSRRPRTSASQVGNTGSNPVRNANATATR